MGTITPKTFKLGKENALDTGIDEICFYLLEIVDISLKNLSAD